MKVFLLTITLLISVLGIAFIYFESDVYLSSITVNEIEEDLQISFSNQPTLIELEKYGWAEEWGEKTIFSLNEIDCNLVNSKMKGSEAYSKKSDYHDLFYRNEIYPVTVKTWVYVNDHLDIKQYILDDSSCNLYRLYHVE